MKQAHWLLFITLFGFTEATFAYTPKEGNVTATLGPFVHKTDFEGSPHSPLLGGVGLIANGDINDKGSLEIAMIHFNKAYFRDQGGLNIAEQTELIHITMGYRRWFNPYLSGSLAFTTGYAMGDPQMIRSDFPSGQEIPTSARDPVEYGVDLSIQTDLFNKNDVSLILDTRYNLSLTKKSSEHSDGYGALLALRFMVQEKVPSENSSQGD